MDKKTADKARAELKHALDALSDGSGHKQWGPGVVGFHLWEAGCPGGPKHRDGAHQAARAFDNAAQFVVVQCSVQLPVTPESRNTFIAAMKKLAPVMLEVILESEG